MIHAILIQKDHKLYGKLSNKPIKTVLETLSKCNCDQIIIVDKSFTEIYVSNKTSYGFVKLSKAYPYSKPLKYFYLPEERIDGFIYQLLHSGKKGYETKVIDYNYDLNLLIPLSKESQQKFLKENLPDNLDYFYKDWGDEFHDCILDWLLQAYNKMVGNTFNYRNKSKTDTKIMNICCILSDIIIGNFATKDDLNLFIWEVKDKGLDKSKPFKNYSEFTDKYDTMPYLTDEDKNFENEVEPEDIEIEDVEDLSDEDITNTIENIDDNDLLDFYEKQLNYVNGEKIFDKYNFKLMLMKFNILKKYDESLGVESDYTLKEMAQELTDMYAENGIIKKFTQSAISYRIKKIVSNVKNICKQNPEYRKKLYAVILDVED